MKSSNPKMYSLMAAALVMCVALVAGSATAYAQLGQGGAGAPARPDQTAEAADEPAPADERSETGESDEPAQADHPAKFDEPAQGERPTVAESSRASQERTIPGGTLVIAAYGALWVLIFGFVFVVMRRQHKLGAEIETLERRMDEVFDDLD